MKQFYRLPLFIVLFLCLKAQAQSTVAEATSVSGSSAYYMSNIMGSDPFDPMGGEDEFFYPAQTFKATLTTTLTAIQFYIFAVHHSGAANLEIYSCGAPNSWGSLLGVKNNISINTTGWVTADISSLNIPVSENSYYGFRIVPQLNLTAHVGTTTTPYADGTAWTNILGFVLSDCSFKVTGDAILPVDLLSFTAQREKNNVLLKWNTTTENNSKNFVLQHSTNQKDWHDITTVAAAGNSNAIINYQYLHTDPASGANFYRIRQVDIDDKSNLSQVVTVNMAELTSSFHLLTNPVINGSLQFQLSAPDELYFYNSNGVPLWSKRFSSGLQQVDVSAYSKGVYFLRNKEFKIRKIVIQ